MTLKLWSAVWSLVTKRKEEGGDRKIHRHRSISQMNPSGMLTTSFTQEASCSYQQCNGEYAFEDTNFNGKRCSFEEEVQEELGMKTLHTPNRCVYLYFCFYCILDEK